MAGFTKTPPSVTTPGKGWFAILRLYSPEQPFFDKTWQPGEVEPAD